MRDIAKAAYEATAVGETGWIRPDPKRGERVENFDGVVVAAEIMQSDGFILIQEMHRESQTGRRLADAIKFMRVK